MKSYLSLIPISAKAHRRQNRMTLLCIIISVFLVTTVFTVADMMIRTESALLMEKHGSWQIRIENITENMAEEIGQRPDVAAVGRAAAYNKDGDKPFYMNEKKVALYGTEETYITRLTNGLEEGVFPKKEEEIMLSSNAKDALQVQIGDKVRVRTPGGDEEFTISGFGSDDESYYQGQTYLIGAYMTQDAFTALMEKNEIVSTPVYYLQFQDGKAAAKAILSLQKQYDLPKNSISENTAVMGLSGNSSNEAMKNIYGIAAILFVLVLLAGALMISGSMNSNVAQRTRFFGMLRCIGASRQQIIRFVRLEALNWCKTAVPVGLILGTGVSWGICGLLHYGIGGEFITMPVFKLSLVGLVSGVVVGIVTVLLAARSPARRAAKVSPAAAISVSQEKTFTAGHAFRLHSGKVEWTLGIHHATGAKKNWALMTASFALSILLFFCFSVGMDFARALLPSLRPWQPDLSFNGYGNAQILDRKLVEEIREIPGVKSVFGSTCQEHVPATSSRSKEPIYLVSYDAYLLQCAKGSLVRGEIAKVKGDSNKVLTVYNKNNSLRAGDTIQIAGTKVEITGVLSDGLFGEERVVICSQETFDRLMGEQKYSIIGVKLDKTATEETVKRIRSMAGKEVIFSDVRQSNQETIATYWATRVVGYGFLLVIGMITLFHIINSISMSVQARTKQYGAMRAVGMDGGQLTGMVLAEALTYAFSGLLVGCVAGIPLSRFIYLRLITRYFGIPWTMPFALTGILIVFVLLGAAAAVYGPTKRICRMAVTDTINEL